MRVMGVKEGDRRETGKLQTAAEEKSQGCFGSEVGVAVTLPRLSSVVSPLSVAVPLVLPVLPPALVVMAPVTVSSSSWWRSERNISRKVKPSGSQ